MLKLLNTENWNIKEMSYDILISKLEKARKEEAEHWKALDTAFNKTSIGICFVGPDGKFLNVNDSAVVIFGRTKEELKTLKWQDITKDEFIHIDQVDTLKSGESETYFLPKIYLRPNGDEVPSLLEVCAVKDPETQVVKYFISKILDLESLQKWYRLLRKQKTPKNS